MLPLIPLLAACLIAAAPDEPQPAIAVMPTTRDFGHVFEPELTWTWTFRNLGKAPLEVTAPGCDCARTGFTLPAGPTAPATAGEVRFAVTLNHRQPGPGERRVTVTTNDPQYPRINLTVRWNYVPIAKLSPPDIRIGPVAPGAGGEAYVTLLSRDPNIELIDIASGSSFITLTPTDDKAPSADPVYPGRIVLKAALSPEAHTGQILDRLTIKTRVTPRAGEEPRIEELTAQIDAQIKSEFELDRRFLRFPETTPGQPINAAGFITSRTTSPFRITAARIIDAPFDTLSVEVKDATTPPHPEGQSVNFGVFLTGTAPDQPGLYQGAVELQTDRPLESPIRIPFNLTVQREPALDGSPNRPAVNPGLPKPKAPAAP